MKLLFMIPLITGWMVCDAQKNDHSQKFNEHISKEFSLTNGSGHIVCVYNLSGSVKVEGYSGNKVIIEVDKTLSASTASELNKGKKEFKLEFEQHGDSVIAYIAEPFDTRPHQNWHQKNHEKIYYDFKTDFVVKVPYDVNLHASTINEGNVFVKDVAGTLQVSNINGSVEIVNAKGTTEANTINGDLTVNYVATPTEACSYYDLNGKLTVTYPATLSANLRFKSMNGQFFTDFPDAEALPNNVVRSDRKNGSSTIYKLEQNTEVKIGNGGQLFRFETLNGNIYIKKQS